VIINGKVEGTGLDANELASLMLSAERGDSGPSVGFAGGQVTVGAAAPPVAEPTYGSLATIRALLKSRSSVVTREVILLGHRRGEAAKFPLPAAEDPDLAEAVIVQTAGAGPVIAAAR
jgi:hypothetical protein